MKITITREIDVPKELICNYGRSGKCNALTDTDSEDIKLCANFNSYCYWSDLAGYFLRCKNCVDAQRKYLQQKG